MKSLMINVSWPQFQTIIRKVNIDYLLKSSDILVKINIEENQGKVPNNFMRTRDGGNDVF